jgi:hypothetical protein
MAFLQPLAFFGQKAADTHSFIKKGFIIKKAGIV